MTNISTNQHRNSSMYPSIEKGEEIVGTSKGRISKAGWTPQAGRNTVAEARAVAAKAAHAHNIQVNGMPLADRVAALEAIVQELMKEKQNGKD